MASRNRPRGAFVKDDASDAHEERNMWSQIVTDIKRLRVTHARAAEVAKMQVDLEAKIGKSKLHRLQSYVGVDNCHGMASEIIQSFKY